MYFYISPICIYLLFVYISYLYITPIYIYLLHLYLRDKTICLLSNLIQEFRKWVVLVCGLVNLASGNV